MLIFLSCGRFKITRQNGNFRVQTPVEQHINNFVEHYSNGSEITRSNGLYSVTIGPTELMDVMSSVIRDVDYTAFKASAYNFDNAEEYHHDLEYVWGAMLR